MGASYNVYIEHEETINFDDSDIKDLVDQSGLSELLEQYSTSAIVAALRLIDALDSVAEHSVTGSTDLDDVLEAADPRDIVTAMLRIMRSDDLLSLVLEMREVD